MTLILLFIIPPFKSGMSSFQLFFKLFNNIFMPYKDFYVSSNT